jgi:hypothetical protein
MATKIGLGEITDVHLNNFGMITGGAKPGNPTYDTALSRLVEKGGDSLKGVSDPLEHITSAVSRHVEENGLTPLMRTEHARISEALAEGREISPFNSMMHKSRDYGMTMREGALAAPVPSAAPSAADLKAAGAKIPETIPPTSTADLSPEKMSFIETIKAEKAATEETARKAIPATKQSIEESGYLYHYAPREARDSITSGGFDVSKARTAVGDVVGEASEFATHVPENSMYFYTRPQDAPSAGTIFGTGETGQRPDLYRTKIEPGMLDDMVVDPRLPVRDGVGSAVIVPSKTGKFEAELIGENAKFGIRGDNISPATYDPIRPAPPVVASPPPDTVTAAGRNRPMVAANYDKMSDDELLKHYAGAKANYEKQLIIDPDGKAFMPTTRSSMESAGEKLRARGIHPDDAAPSVAKASATKVTPLVDEYDTGVTAAKVASGETLAEAPPVGPKRGPSDLGTPAGIKTKPGPHGVSVTAPTTPTAPIVPTTSPTAPTAKILTNTPGDNLTAREAIRGIGEEIKAARKPGQRLMSAQGSKAMSEAVTKGIKGSRNLKMLAISSALGIGGYGANRIARRNDTSDLEG